MAEQSRSSRKPDPDDVGPGTQPADARVDRPLTGRPQATQALFRPDFDDDDDDIRSLPVPTPSRRTA